MSEILHDPANVGKLQLKNSNVTIISARAVFDRKYHHDSVSPRTTVVRVRIRALSRTNII